MDNDDVSEELLLALLLLMDSDCDDVIVSVDDGVLVVESLCETVAVVEIVLVELSEAVMVDV
jgi:hypothetical protein